MRVVHLIAIGFLFAASALVAASCSSGGAPVTCGGFTCEPGKQCCNNCGTPVCSNQCTAISCATDSGGVACGATTCAPGDQCCTDCNGNKSCGQACPGIACPADAGPDGADDAPADVAAN